jgi:hypothetical protein
MATLLISNCLVTPTENDVYGGGSAGDGRILQELYLQKLWRYGQGHAGGVISGFAVPTSDADLTASITAGSAVIGGYYIVTADPTSHSFTHTKDTHVWLCLVVDGNSKVTRAEFYYAEATVGAARPTAPTTGYSGVLYLGFTTTDDDNITTGEDHRPEGRVAWGTLKSTGSYITDYGSGDWTATYGSGYWTVTFATAWIRKPCVAVEDAGSATQGYYDRTNSTTSALRIYPGATGVSCFIARL